MVSSKSVWFMASSQTTKAADIAQEALPEALSDRQQLRRNRARFLTFDRLPCTSQRREIP